MAFGQFGVVVDPAKVDVACPDEECHVAPVFMGEGGFVGELADGFDMANFVVTCGNTTASGSAAGDGGGVVRQLFSMANGLACHAEGGSIQIHGLADGGWYWINDDMNSAVSPLIAKDALMGDEVMPTDPGGVTLMAGDYGTYVKSGDRVGILPHFVPTAPVEIPEIPEPEAATICMPVWDPEGGTPGEGTWVANAKNCMLGDGGTVIKMTMTANGSSSEVTSVHRDPDGGVVQVRLDLWGNGSGHVASSTTNPFLGWDVPSSRGRRPQPFDAYFWISPDRTGKLGTSLANDAGITLTRGGRMNVPPKKVPVPAADTGNNESTPEREDGYTKDYNKDANAAMRDAARCTQDTDERSIGDAGKKATFILWAGTDGEEVAIQDTDDAVIEGDLPADEADLMGLEAWVTAFNSRTDGSKDIETVTVRDESGENDVDRTIPAVICEMMDDPEHEAATRYVSGTINISPDTVYCNDNNNQSATVYVFASSARATRYGNSVTPPIAQESYPNLDPNYWRQGLNASTALQVHCAE